VESRGGEKDAPCAESTQSKGGIKFHRALRWTQTGLVFSGAFSSKDASMELVKNLEEVAHYKVATVLEYLTSHSGAFQA
jgi:hypothetical protein